MTDMQVTNIVWVEPSPGHGIEYKAEIEEILDGKARVRPLTVALSSPAWANSVRPRWVKLSKLRLVQP
jgi:hypothetical protein